MTYTIESMALVSLLSIWESYYQTINCILRKQYIGICINIMRNMADIVRQQTNMVKVGENVFVHEITHELPRLAHSFIDM